MADSVDTGSARIEIVLADDHAMIRSGLRRVLDSEPDLAVVAEAADVEAAIRETQTHQPDALVVDLNMPGAPTLPAIPRFLEASPGTAVIVLTMDGEPAHARRALRAGARGYVLKDAADTELVEAVRAVVNGRTYVDPNLGARLATMGGDASARLAGLSQGIPELAVGADFAGHRIDKVIGRGGMGVVFRATDRALDRTVALKLIAPEVANDPVFRARFERECRLAAAIDHPHAVQIFQAGEEDGLLYLTMRYVDGTNLRRLLRTEGRLPPARGVAIIGQIASALDEAHALGLVHRDVKPENILVLERPPAEQAFLTDFGITKRATDEPLTRTGRLVGTVDYSAPEQVQGGDVDARADVYSLGCVLFHMLSGNVLFDRPSDLDKLWAHVHEPPPKLLSLRPDLPAPLGEAVDRALSKDREDRQQSAGELAREAGDALPPDPKRWS